jgi:hypothetical protein
MAQDRKWGKQIALKYFSVYQRGFKKDIFKANGEA